MKKIIVPVLCFILLLAVSCSTLSFVGKNRALTLDGYEYNEQDYGGVVRWYAVEEYSDDFIEKPMFQVGYFNSNEMGFVLYGNGTIGEEAYFSRQGLDLRWDWGNYYRDGVSKYRYAFVIEPDGTGLYYDFSTSTNGTASPRGRYKCRKF